MPEGGALTIETRNMDGSGHPALRNQSYAVCEVRDTGVGIPEGLLEQAFEPFVTTKEEGRGTGLGLATCFGIIQQFGGHIEIESQVGVGTTVRFMLPRTDQVLQAPAAPTVRGPIRGTESILVVEDDPGVRTLIAHALQGMDYQVQSAATAEEALRIMEAGEIPIDLVVSDVVMPGMRGDRLVAKLREGGPLAALFVSGYPRDASLQLDPDSGTGFLQKPFTIEQLGQKVRALLDAFAAARSAPKGHESRS
jgi:CheY-like chemotaxis protein